ncbi:MAG TPA: CPBP family intramembrane glutamic endopeptidase [Candidatus Angelobacter sp.]|nr:CPBP family intramembrane glutamic endopeptidase [Candidatus Angelobacter sp.]
MIGSDSQIRFDVPSPLEAEALGSSSRRKLALGMVLYCLLLAVFWSIARFFNFKPLQGHPISTTLGFALMFAPYWLFGFGLADVLRRLLPTGWVRVLASVLLTAPYYVLAISRGEFNWTMAWVMPGIALLITGALQLSASSLKDGDFQDFLVLTALGIMVDLRFLHSAWPAGLGGFSKMILADVALYGYLVIKPIEGIGYDLSPTFSDIKFGLRELFFYAPIVLTLGLALGFLHPHAVMPKILQIPASWIFTFSFVALPEELFFRGVVQNLLERKLGRRQALFLASILFGLSHFNKGNPHGVFFNWRYVLLATIAGIFYGRAWRAEKRLFASSFTHASVDTIWSLWFR